MRHRSLIIALIVGLSILWNCSDSSKISEPGYDNTLEPDTIYSDIIQDIEIAYGQVVLIESENLKIAFSNVTDSRCPIGAVCFWEGQAEIELSLYKPDQDPVVAKPFIRPGADPDKHPDLSAYARGYKITLLSLDPYPELNQRTNRKEYRAIIRIEEFPYSGRIRHVRFTWSSPQSLQVDEVEVTEGFIIGDILILTVRYGGGCGDHGFKLFMQPAFMESYPCQANLYLQHVNHNDYCEAIISEELLFDIRRIAELYRDQYGAYDDVILNIYGYFSDIPTNKITVTYSPE